MIRYEGGHAVLQNRMRWSDATGTGVRIDMAITMVTTPTCPASHPAIDGWVGSVGFIGGTPFGKASLGARDIG